MRNVFDDLSRFFDYCTEKKVVPVATVNDWRNAVKAITPFVDDGDQTSDYVLTQHALILNRLQNGNTNIKGESAVKYVQRARKAVEHFIDWSSDRAAWERRLTAAKSGSKADRKPRIAIRAPGPAQSTSAPAAEATRTGAFRTYATNHIRVPVGQNDGFAIDLPTSYTQSDVIRVTWQLAAHAIDFDPATMLHAFGKPQAHQDRPATRAVAIEPEVLPADDE